MFQRLRTLALKERVDLRWFEVSGAGRLEQCPDGILFLAEALAAFGGSRAETFGIRCESCVGVVLAQEDAILGARGEHAIRLIHAFRHQVIDKHPDVSFVAAQREGRIPRATQCGIDTCHDALARRLLVAGGSVDLSGEEQTAHSL